MSVRFLFALIIFFILTGCDNNFFPAGLYDYQVERLLSNDTSKVWNQVVGSRNCEDSVKLFVELIPSNQDDSLAISTLNPRLDCNGFDTLLIGNADASSFEGAILFTDSLNFGDGVFWIIESITSNTLTLRIDNVILNYIQ